MDTNSASIKRVRDRDALCIQQAHCNLSPFEDFNKAKLTDSKEMY